MSETAIDTTRDAMLVPGIYEHCDHWCEYCAMTARCMAHRRFAALEREKGADSLDDMEELVRVSREIHAAEGRPSPELDVLASPNPAMRNSLPEVDDPLDDLGWRYATEAGRFLSRRRWVPPVRPGRQPAPIDVVAWYHVLIWTRLSRAVASASGRMRGRTEGARDANGCAKLVLVGIDRSRAALNRLRGARDDTRVVALLETLDRLTPAIERRFPDARTFIRPGLDAPVV